MGLPRPGHCWNCSEPDPKPPMKKDRRICSLQGGRSSLLPVMAMIPLALAVLLLPSRCARAQQNQPRLGYVYPGGAQQGTTVEIYLGGQRLGGAEDVIVSGGGVRVVVQDYFKPMPPGQFTKLRDEARALIERKQEVLRPARRGARQARQPAAPTTAAAGTAAGTSTRTNTATNEIALVWTDADEKRLQEIRDAVRKNPPNRAATMAIAEVVSLRVEVATNAAPGWRELRLLTATGLSNPMRFEVAALPEISKPRLRPQGPELAGLRRLIPDMPQGEPPGTNLVGSIPAIINGQIGPGGTDRIRFEGRQGQELRLVLNARALVPYIADAVPGWFQVAVRVFDSKGTELASSDPADFRIDSVLHFQLPSTGTFEVRVEDALRRGREDFVYRLHLELQAPPNQSAQAQAEPADGRIPLLSQSPLLSNWQGIAHVRENEPNSKPSQGQHVALPSVVDGVIGQNLDVDCFRFNGLKGEVFVAEVLARRTGSPLDSRLILLDPKGREIARNDDTEDPAAGMLTHQADSYLRVELPETGLFTIQIADAQGHGGQDYTYQLRVGPPRPDFVVHAVPASLSGRAGTTVTFDVRALRRDGFTNNAISFVLEDPPKGFQLQPGATIGPGKDTARLTLNLPKDGRMARVATVRIQAKASIGGREILHAVIPAEERTQAFSTHHLVAAQDLMVAVLPRPGLGLKRLGGLFGAPNR